MTQKDIRILKTAKLLLRAYYTNQKVEDTLYVNLETNTIQSIYSVGNKDVLIFQSPLTENDVPGVWVYEFFDPELMKKWFEMDRTKPYREQKRNNPPKSTPMN